MPNLSGHVGGWFTVGRGGGLTGRAGSVLVWGFHSKLNDAGSQVPSVLGIQWPIAGQPVLCATAGSRPVGLSSYSR